MVCIGSSLTVLPGGGAARADAARRRHGSRWSPRARRPTTATPSEARRRRGGRARGGAGAALSRVRPSRCGQRGSGAAHLAAVDPGPAAAPGRAEAAAGLNRSGHPLAAATAAGKALHALSRRHVARHAPSAPIARWPNLARSTASTGCRGTRVRSRPRWRRREDLVARVRPGVPRRRARSAASMPPRRRPRRSSGRVGASGRPAGPRWRPRPTGPRSSSSGAPRRGRQRRAHLRQQALERHPRLQRGLAQPARRRGRRGRAAPAPRRPAASSRAAQQRGEALLGRLHRATALPPVARGAAPRPRA